MVELNDFAKVKINFSHEIPLSVFDIKAPNNPSSRLIVIDSQTDETVAAAWVIGLSENSLD